MPFRKNEGLFVFILEKGLVSILLLAPLLFGAVHPVSALLISALIFFLLMIAPDSLVLIWGLPRFFCYSMLALFVFVLLQAFFLSMYYDETQSELLRWTALAAGFFIIHRLPETSLKRLLFTIALAGVLESVYGLAQLHSGHEMVLWKIKKAHQGFVTGTYLNRNHLAGLLEICLGVQLGFFLSALWKKEKWRSMGWALCLMISLAAFLETSSRMGILSFFLSFSWMAFFLPLPSKSKSVFYLLLGGVMILAFWHGWNVLGLRLRNLEEGFVSATSRFFVWKDTLRMLRDHIWFGIGLGNFQWVFPSYQSENILMGWSHAHQDYLELAVELGIPAVALFLFSFGSLWAFLFKSYCYQPRVENKAYPFMWGGLLGLFSFALHGLADFNFAIPANAIFFIFLLGILSRREKAVSLPKKVFWLVRFAALFLIVLCVQKAWARPEDNPSQQIRKMPFYGRAWLNLGLSRLKMEEASPDGVTAVEWPAIRDIFSSAYQKEPGSAWMAYMTSQAMLRYPQYISEEERKSALEKMRKSVSHHHPHQASYLLKSALEFLWRRFSDFELLKWITPHDFASYQVLMAFTKEHKLASQRAEIFQEFEKMREGEYVRRCEEAEKWFERGDDQKAFQAYQRAYWIGHEKDRAKLGMQAAKEQLEKEQRREK